MIKVSSILKRKGAKVEGIPPTSTVIDALKLMAEKNIGSVVIMEGDKFLGIMTERDYSRKVILKGKNSTSSLVSDIMSTDCPAISPDDRIELCMQKMTDKSIRYLPVFEKEKLVGIISMSDVVKATILAQKETIDELKNYIQS